MINHHFSVYLWHIRDGLGKQVNIIMGVNFDGIPDVKGDVNPHFPSRSHGETRRYYICNKQLACVFPSGGVRSTSTSKTSENGVSIGE